MKRFRKKRRFSTVRQPMGMDRLKRSNAWTALRWIIVIALISVGVLAMIFFGFPLVEDLIKGVDPALRYQPKVEKDFEFQVSQSRPEEYEVQEIYLTEYKIKNDPYPAGDKIIFTTHSDESNLNELDSVAIYNITTGEAELLPNVEKKYDNLMLPRMSGEFAVWIDSLADGGGRIVGYDLINRQQFLIKEYAYAMPELSLEGDTLAFMQWAGDTVQRLYVYNIRTREAATVKLYETEVGNSAVDVSDKDIVWSEYKKDENGQVSGTLKRIVLDGNNSFYDNYNLGTQVFEPKTNGKDLVFATDKDITGGSLMLSTGGGEPRELAEGVLSYDIGDDFVVYTKDDMVFLTFTNQQDTYELTSDISKSLLVSVNHQELTFYDITDGSIEEVVKYVQVE